MSLVCDLSDLEKRRRRPRRPLVGMMLHIDGSKHRWLQEDQWHDLFCALNSDPASHFFATPKAGEKVNKTRLTQLGRAMKELSVQMTPAYSQQARGRLVNITTVEAAREFHDSDRACGGQGQHGGDSRTLAIDSIHPLWATPRRAIHLHRAGRCPQSSQPAE